MRDARHSILAMSPTHGGTAPGSQRMVLPMLSWGLFLAYTVCVSACPGSRRGVLAANTWCRCWWKNMIAAQNYQAMIAAVSDEDFPLALRMQLESVDFADLPDDLQAALSERAARLAIAIASRNVS